MGGGDGATASGSRAPPGSRASWLLLAACLAMAGCAPELSDAPILLDAERVELTDSGGHELIIAAPAGAAVFITVAGHGLDLRAGAGGDAGSSAAFVDAPNRRMGIETLLVESAPAAGIALRIERNDHHDARGHATVTATVLPVATADDRRRLEAARLETEGCRQFGELALGRESARAYAAAAELHRRLRDRTGAGRASLHAAGARYLRLSDWAGAAHEARLAREDLRIAGLPVREAYALRLGGAALDQLAQAGETEGASREGLARNARRLLTEAAERFRALGEDYEAGYALSYRGVSHEASGERAAARADYEAALERFVAAGDPPARALSLQSLALLAHGDGRSADALREFDRALTLIPRDAEPANYAHTLNNSALPLRALGRFDEATARYHEAIALLAALGDRDGQARALHGLGTVQLYAGEPDKAAELLRAAVELRGSGSASKEQAISLILLGRIEAEAGRHAAAVALHRRALSMVVAPHDRSQALLALARSQAADGDGAGARERLESVLALGLPPTHRYLALALAEIGVLDAQAGRTEAAEARFERAIGIHAGNGSGIDLARTELQRARARLDRGDATAALADARSAHARLEAIGLSSLQAEGRAAFRASFRDAVELAIAALIAEADSARAAGDAGRADRLVAEALADSDAHRAQWISEGTPAHAPAALAARLQETYEWLAGKRAQRERQLERDRPDARRVAELDREIGLLRSEASLLERRIATGSAATRGRPAGSVLVASVPAGTTALEFFIGSEHGWVFEIRDGVVAAHALPQADGIAGLAQALYEAWRNAGGDAGDRLSLARPLVHRLFGALAVPPPGGALVIVPDGPLHLVPVSLLARAAWPRAPDAWTGVMPSLAALSTAAGRQQPDARRLLAVVADPIYAADDPRIRASVRPARGGDANPGPVVTPAPLQRLPSTGVEARMLREIAGASQALSLTGASAARRQVLAAPLDDYRIVHFATHAFADSRDPALATIALSRWDEDGRPLDGMLRQYDIARLRLDADLVVLSGCETAVGREIAGEGPIGLSHAFLRGGARAVLSTLWRVPDTSTALLMRAFYRRLIVDGRAPPVALRLAQDELRREPRWSDPYYWAGFQLVTNAPPEFLQEPPTTTGGT